MEELQRLGGYANRSQTGILEERVVLDVMGERVHEHVFDTLRVSGDVQFPLDYERIVERSRRGATG